MTASTYEVSISGEIVERGFWIYIWEATTPDGEILLYVGVTGDSSSVNAQSPFNRMGQHLGSAKNSSMLRNHLGNRNVVPERCSFRFIPHGPVLDEATSRAEHDPRRDAMNAMERRLIEDLVDAGYDVMNRSNSKKALDEALYEGVRASFAEHFPNLGS